MPTKKVKLIISKVYSAILDILFPPRCPICRDILKPNEGLIHLKCQSKLKYASEPVCMRCGKPIEQAEEEYCLDCQRRHHYFDSGRAVAVEIMMPSFDSGRAVWIYEQHMQQSIVWYKYKHCKEFSKFYASEMIAYHKTWLKYLHLDAVIPIPLNRKKYRMRGYNQAEPLAAYIASELGCKLDTHTLVRSRWTAPQKDLGPSERFNNLKRAFSVDKKAARAYKCVLLVDDIYTTGSTMDACAHQLKAAGVDKVYFITMCIGSERN